MQQLRLEGQGFCNKLYLGSGIKNAIKTVSLFLVAFLTACNNPAIYTDPDFNPPVYWGNHVVMPGETLYSIAWRYGRDYKELAKINSISPPYTIFPDQKISLKTTESVKKTVKSSPHKPSKSSSKKTKPEVVSKTKSSVYKKKQKVGKRLTKPTSRRYVGWSWPHSGPIIDRYSVTGDVNKGVDIAGKVGDPVLAAASGEVVYAGSGLLGYGKLVIINHSDEFLSAYAHNRNISVKEGEPIRQGQKIAELGESGTNRPKLHFEIRKNGKPVNPLIYLPKR